MKWVGAPDGAPQIPIAPASPVNLDATSFGDRLKERFPGARVVGLVAEGPLRRADGRAQGRCGTLVRGTLRAIRDVELLPAAARAARLQRAACPRSSPHRASDLGALRAHSRGGPRSPHVGRGGIKDATAQPDGYRAAFPHALDNPKAIVVVSLGRRARPGARALRHRIAAAGVARRPARPPVRRALFDRLLRPLVRARLEGDRRRPRAPRRVARGVLRVARRAGRAGPGPRF